MADMLREGFARACQRFGLQGEVVVADPDSQDQTASVTLRYWSAQYKNLFTAEAAFPFVNDDQKGTVAAPFVPDFMVAK